MTDAEKIAAGPCAADVECPLCGAKAGATCVTRTGWGARTHAERFRAAGIRNHDAGDHARAGEAFRQARLERTREQGRNTPYELGYRSGALGHPAPPFPTGDASWAERLYNRGYEDGRAIIQGETE